MQAKDIMTRDVVSISPQVGVRHAVAVMLQNGVSGLPVVDEEGRVRGMLTEGDLLLRREIRVSPRTPRGPEMISETDLERYISSNGWSVADVMSPDVIVARPDSEISDIAESLQAHRIKRLPIVENGKLVGIVSRRDILGLILDAPTTPIPREDESIKLAVRTRLRSDLGLTPQKIQVTVKNGQVTLEGLVESELKRKAVRSLVESLGIGGYKDCLSVTEEHGS
ncbi:CBS domain-containing protein [Rhizobium sp. 25PS6]|uniref:CBS domain-containing protein n=1 Tax=Rhizobium TaxID=379 RepID=UPI00104090DD|nr:MULTISPECIES: CBS domain-containing protein [Rhizobium]MBY3186710.1 CBS domain-containing protein [Rhizobium laguerreae]MBY3226191.1 CBS domain-containing protein [Rhizobium laguerreae]MBY3239795.1 CBS domain-containing protein [Rhizobium laguerreae]MBY5841862.1 CBS domain-containing protein [Rhizobium leguminosarum]MBY5870382.1 CBS domain-containing protein [Rhizobium leguminosarum]